MARSAYFYDQAIIDRQDKQIQLKEAINQIFTNAKQRYGCRRVLAELRKLGWQVNHKLVFKLMNRWG